MSNNQYFTYNCPALMEDGRFLTNYTRSRRFDQEIRNINNIDSAQDYKDFLQKNTETILAKEREYNIINNKCNFGQICPPSSAYPPYMPQPVPPLTCNNINYIKLV